MIKFNFAHICEDVYLLQNGTPAVIGIFSEIIGENKPIIRPKMALILNFTPNDKEPHIIDIVIKSPSGEKIKEYKGNKVGLQEEQDQNLGFIMDFYNIKLEEEGVYNFEIFIDNNLITTLPLVFTVKTK